MANAHAIIVQMTRFSQVEARDRLSIPVRISTLTSRWRHLARRVGVAAALVFASDVTLGWLVTHGRVVTLVRVVTQGRIVVFS